MKRTLAKQLVQRLKSEGFEALWAGGCVRDMVMGRTPKDFDIASNATPAQIQKVFAHTIPVGISFGVIIVVEDGVPFEVATFRSDGTYTDGRRPDSVSFGTASEDAQRRDFTMNGLFYDPLQETLVDLVGGRADIEARLIKCIGDPHQRFTEDKLRMLRAVRFASSLDFTIEPETWSAIRELSSSVVSVSPERIREELTKMLVAPRAGRGLDLCFRSGLLAWVLPEMIPTIGCPQPPQWHPEGDVFVHTCLMLDSLESPSPELAWSVLLHDVAKPDCLSITPEGRIGHNGHEKVGADKAVTILQRLRASNSFIERVQACVLHHMQFKDVQKMRLSTLKKMMHRPTFEEEMELHRVDCLSSHRKLGNYDYLRAKQQEIPPQSISPTPLLSGHEVIAAGASLGPQVGQILARLRDLQLDGEVTTKEAALAKVRQWILKTEA